MNAAGMTLLDRAILTGLIQSFPYDMRKYPLLALFPRRSYNAGEITWETVTGARGAATFVDVEGNPRMIARDGLAQSSATPAHVKEGTALTQKELSILRQPGTEVTDTQARIVAEVLQKLNARRNERFHQMCVDMLCSGTVTAPSTTFGPAFSLSYGWTALTAPSTAWSSTSATPLEDVQNAILEFQDNAGYSPTHAFYNAKVVPQKLMKITQWLDFVKSSPGTADAVRRAQMGPTQLIADTQITWVPVAGQWLNDSNTLADRWTINKITFAALDGAAIGEWATERNSVNDESGNAVAWSDSPQDGRRGSTSVFAYDNGLPIVRDKNAVQTWTVYS